VLQVLTDCTPCGYVVDWVRSAYKSVWRLPAKGGISVAGQYLFAGPDAPHFPTAHYWGSRNWRKGTHITNDKWGETLSATQKWADGGGFQDAPPPNTSVSDNSPCCRTPCNPEGIPQCGGIENASRYINLKLQFGKFNYQWTLNRDPLSNVFESIYGTNDPDILAVNCAPSPTLGKLHIGRATLRLVCPEGDHPFTEAVTFVLVISVDGDTYDFGFFDDNVEPGTFFPYYKAMTSKPDDFTIHCANGNTTDILRVTVESSNTPLDPGPIPAADTSGFYMGFPTSCWSTAPGPSGRPWPFSPFDFNWRRTAAELICFQYRFPPVALTKFTALMGPNYHVSQINNSSALVPGTLIAVSTGRAVCVVSGSTTAQQLVLQGVQSLSAPHDFGTYATLPLWDQGATVVMNRLLAAGMSGSAELAIVGHSYGGAVAQIVAYRLARANPRRKISLLTFGTPPVGQLPKVGPFPESIVSTFLANDGDPTNLLPPPVPQMIQLLPFCATLPFAKWQQWKRPRLTTRITTAGEFVTDDDLTVSFADLVDFVNAVLAGGFVNLGEAHLAPEYVRRLWLPASPPTRCGDPG